MIYPKPFMTRSALMEMGIPRKMLDRAAREKGQEMVCKGDSKKKNSPMHFDTAAFEEWRKEQCRLMNLEIPDEKRRS